MCPPLKTLSTAPCPQRFVPWPRTNRACHIRRCMRTYPYYTFTFLSIFNTDLLDKHMIYLLTRSYIFFLFLGFQTGYGCVTTLIRGNDCMLPLRVVFVYRLSGYRGLTPSAYTQRETVPSAVHDVHRTCRWNARALMLQWAVQNPSTTALAGTPLGR